jgi:hypothetical protein
MCHPQVIVSRQLMRHHEGNTLKYQDNHEGLRTLPLNPVECDLERGMEGGQGHVAWDEEATPDQRADPLQDHAELIDAGWDV